MTKISKEHDFARLVELTDAELDHVVGGDVAPGLLGYEGQPGNQGGGPTPGLLGYEGQPGNQGG
jgi:hypothetical protein